MARVIYLGCKVCGQAKLWQECNERWMLEHAGCAVRLGKPKVFKIVEGKDVKQTDDGPRIEMEAGGSN